MELDEGISIVFLNDGVKRGLVIGEFLPLHQGHIALIKFAAGRCDELIVSMSYTANDPIDPPLRFSWIQETFQGLPAIRCEMVLDDFDDESLPIGERTKIWSAFIRMRYPPIDVIFSSEEYGESFGRHLGVPHVAFDIQRLLVPVSSTLIREQPLAYWEYIPVVVRPYFVKKVCFYGPESTGKTTMAKHLADVYQTEYVPEVAREMITSNDFTEDDIIRIGYAQTERVLERVKTANKLLFCDTDLITSQIYSQTYLHRVPDILYELERLIKYDLYFLFDIDLPWVDDGLRDLGNQRNEMYDVFKNELVKRKIPFIDVRGNHEEREEIIKKELNRLT